MSREVSPARDEEGLSSGCKSNSSCYCLLPPPLHPYQPVGPSHLYPTAPVVSGPSTRPTPRTHWPAGPPVSHPTAPWPASGPISPSAPLHPAGQRALPASLASLILSPADPLTSCVCCRRSGGRSWVQWSFSSPQCPCAAILSGSHVGKARAREMETEYFLKGSAADPLGSQVVSSSCHIYLCSKGLQLCLSCG